MSWEGTDENLHYMVSASSRLENFDRWGIKDMYQSMLKYDSNSQPTRPEFGDTLKACIDNWQDPAQSCLKLIKKPATDDIEDYRKANP